VKSDLPDIFIPLWKNWLPRIVHWPRSKRRGFTSRKPRLDLEWISVLKQVLTLIQVAASRSFLYQPSTCNQVLFACLNICTSKTLVVVSWHCANHISSNIRLLLLAALFKSCDIWQLIDIDCHSDKKGPSNAVSRLRESLWDARQFCLEVMQHAPSVGQEWQNSHEYMQCSCRP